MKPLIQFNWTSEEAETVVAALALVNVVLFVTPARLEAEVQAVADREYVPPKQLANVKGKLRSAAHVLTGGKVTAFDRIGFLANVAAQIDTWLKENE